MTSLATTEIQIRVEGTPAPKGSRNHAVSKSGHVYTWPASTREKPWVQEVKKATQAIMRRQPPIPPPYMVDVELLIKRPVNPTNQWPSRHDLDKLMRAVIDGLVFGKAISDDRHIVEIHARKRYAAPDEPPGAIARITTIGP